jgi:hypothetical protein
MPAYHVLCSQQGCLRAGEAAKINPPEVTNSAGCACNPRSRAHGGWDTFLWLLGWVFLTCSSEQIDNKARDKGTHAAEQRGKRFNMGEGCLMGVVLRCTPICLLAYPTCWRPLNCPVPSCPASIQPARQQPSSVHTSRLLVGSLASLPVCLPDLMPGRVRAHMRASLKGQEL